MNLASFTGSLGLRQRRVPGNQRGFYIPKNQKGLGMKPVACRLLGEEPTGVIGGDEPLVAPGNPVIGIGIALPHGGMCD